MDRRDRPREPSQSDKASAGHDRASDQRSGSLFEVLDAPLPSEMARRGRRDDEPVLPDYPKRSERATRSRKAGRTAAPVEPPREKTPVPSRRVRPEAPVGLQEAPVGQTAVVQRPAVQPTRRARRPGAVRRVKRRITHVDPISVLKISFVFYMMFLVVWLIVVALFYNVLDGMGLFDQLRDLGQDLVLPALENEITLGAVEKWALIVGVIFVVAGSILNAFLAFLYNVVSDIIGGIDVTFQERE